MNNSYGDYMGGGAMSPAAAAYSAVPHMGGAMMGAPMAHPPPAAAISSNAEMMRQLAAEVARLQLKVKEKRAREAAAKEAAGSEAAMLAALMSQIGELKKELGEE